MKQRPFLLLLLLVAALSAAAVLLQAPLAGVFSSALAFPFEQLGLLLRSLSLQGRIGNAAAIALLTALSLVPIWALLFAKSRRALHWEDALLALLALALAVGLFLMANPAKLVHLFPLGVEAMLPMAKALIGGCIWSILLGYFVLRVLRLSLQCTTPQLWRALDLLLRLASLLFVCAAFGTCLSETRDMILNLRENNTGAASLTPTIAFFWLRYLVSALPWLLDVGAALLALRLLHTVKADPSSEEVVHSAQKLARWCARALSAVVASVLLLNVLQLLFSRTIYDIHTSLLLPVTSVLFVFCALLFSRLIEENRSLKQDNDLFI